MKKISKIKKVSYNFLDEICYKNKVKIKKSPLPKQRRVSK